MTTINIIDAESYGLSPAVKTFNVLKVGNPNFAELNVSFVESFGYGLKEAFLNGARLPAQNSTNLKANVIPHLKNGENKLVVIFEHLQIFGQPLGNTQISASLTITGASVKEIPSPTQFFDDVGDSISKNTPTIIGIGLLIVIGLSALAFTSSRLPSFGNIKVTNDSVKSVSSSFKGIKKRISI